MVTTMTLGVYVTRFDGVKIQTPHRVMNYIKLLNTIIMFIWRTF